MKIKSCLVKTGKEAKAFWAAKGISPEEQMVKLTYDRLIVEPNEKIIGAIKNAVREAVQPIYDTLGEKLEAAHVSEDSAARIGLDAMVDELVEFAGKLAFSATIQNNVHKDNSDLPEVPSSAPTATEEDILELGDLEF